MEFPACFKEINVSIFCLREPKKSKWNFKISIFDICQLRDCTFSLQKVPESAIDSGGFPYLFAVLSLIFELKQNLEAQPYPEKN